ncbi:MAG TPA: hypothetical protein VGA18_02540, partial [Rhodothermales bacterium]
MNAFVSTAFEEIRDLPPMDEIGIEKIGGDEQNRDARLAERPIDLREPIAPGLDFFVAPDPQKAFT